MTRIAKSAGLALAAAAFVGAAMPAKAAENYYGLQLAAEELRMARFCVDQARAQYADGFHSGRLDSVGQLREHLIVDLNIWNAQGVGFRLRCRFTENGVFEEMERF